MYFLKVLVKWLDASNQLTFAKREGGFRGMQQTRRFALVLVLGNQGCGLQEADEAAKVVVYEGNQLTISL